MLEKKIKIKIRTLKKNHLPHQMEMGATDPTTLLIPTHFLILRYTSQ